MRQSTLTTQDSKRSAGQPWSWSLKVRARCYMVRAGVGLGKASESQGPAKQAHWDSDSASLSIVLAIELGLCWPLQAKRSWPSVNRPNGRAPDAGLAGSRGQESFRVTVTESRSRISRGTSERPPCFSRKGLAASPCIEPVAVEGCSIRGTPGSCHFPPSPSQLELAAEPGRGRPPGATLRGAAVGGRRPSHTRPPLWAALSSESRACAGRLELCCERALPARGVMTARPPDSP